ncbi:hypothetical protein V500_04936 [Pseudogymnoascus sp. VKM F-4518 (FW-2643)]|nr:hypothetical protein V500_04936 [Pseudogymnoascus sp. VKM F-4518 (FW-2643)]
MKTENSAPPDVRPGREPEEEAEDDEAGHCGASGQPHAEDHDDGEDGSEDHSVKRANLISVEPRQPAPKNRPNIEDDKALVREVLAEPRMERVATYIRQRHEQRPLKEIDSRDCECEDAIAEDAQVGFSAGAVLGREAAADEDAADGEEEDGEEAEAAGCPGPADLGDQVLQHEGVDDAAEGAAGGAAAGGEAAAELEPVPDGGEGGGEDEGCGGAAEDAEDEHEVPLVARDVRLERAQRVHHPQRRQQRAHRPEHHEPRLQPAFGVEVLVFAEGEGVCALGGGGGEDGAADYACFGVVEGELGAGVGVGVGDAAAGFGGDDVQPYCVVVVGLPIVVVRGALFCGGLVVGAYDLFVLHGLNAMAPRVFLLTTHHERGAASAPKGTEGHDAPFEARYEALAHGFDAGVGLGGARARIGAALAWRNGVGVGDG